MLNVVMLSVVAHAKMFAQQNPMEGEKFFLTGVSFSFRHRYRDPSSPHP
jgi:hypothetical protein